MRKSLLLVAAIATLLLSGCASVSSMPLGQDAKAVDVSKKSILIAKLSIKNENAPSQQPDLCCIFVTEKNQKDEEVFSYTSPTVLLDKGEGGKEYLVSMYAGPGKNKINTARFLRQVPLLLLASADLRFDMDIEVPANSIVYLGNISATIKEKTDDSQPSAGSLFPLIDQAVAGFSTGTFEVKIADNYDSDVELFRSKYPYLGDMDIVNMVLPAWTHPETRAKAKEAADSSLVQKE